MSGTPCWRRVRRSTIPAPTATWRGDIVYNLSNSIVTLPVNVVRINHILFIIHELMNIRFIRAFEMNYFTSKLGRGRESNINLLVFITPYRTNDAVTRESNNSGHSAEIEIYCTPIYLSLSGIHICVYNIKFFGIYFYHISRKSHVSNTPEESNFAVIFAVYLRPGEVGISCVNAISGEHVNLRASEIGTLNIHRIHSCIRELGSPEVCPLQLSIRQVRSIEVKPDQIGAGRSLGGRAQVDAAQRLCGATEETEPRWARQILHRLDLSGVAGRRGREELPCAGAPLGRALAEIDDESGDRDDDGEHLREPEGANDAAALGAIEPCPARRSLLRRSTAFAGFRQCGHDVPPFATTVTLLASRPSAKREAP